MVVQHFRNFSEMSTLLMAAQQAMNDSGLEKEATDRSNRSSAYCILVGLYTNYSSFLKSKTSKCSLPRGHNNTIKYTHLKNKSMKSYFPEQF